MNRNRLVMRGMACALLLASTASPVFAQTDEEVIVTGRYGVVPDNVQSLSQHVSYADLDLSTKAGKDELHRRVTLTARFLCEKLGEPAFAVPPAPSCRDEAKREAILRADKIASKFPPRGPGWSAPSPWQAPYPADWANRYP